MLLTRHFTDKGIRWACNGTFLAKSFSLSAFLELSSNNSMRFLEALLTKNSAIGPLLSPIDDSQEVWASGVTYFRSREARIEESESTDVYQKAYDAERPELFFKSIGWRVIGHRAVMRVRKDSEWNVPEPEMTLVINSQREIVGYCAGNDLSSRSIEGENPLYLPQAKIYNGSCALGPGVILTDPVRLRDINIEIEIKRSGSSVYKESINISRTYLKKNLDIRS